MLLAEVGFGTGEAGLALAIALTIVFGLVQYIGRDKTSKLEKLEADVARAAPASKLEELAREVADLKTEAAVAKAASVHERVLALEKLVGEIKGDVSWLRSWAADQARAPHNRRHNDQEDGP